MRQEERISEIEWNYFLRGSTGVEGSYPTKPDISWLSDQDWKSCCDLEVTFLLLTQRLLSLKTFYLLSEVPINYCQSKLFL